MTFVQHFSEQTFSHTVCFITALCTHPAEITDKQQIILGITSEAESARHRGKPTGLWFLPGALHAASQLIILAKTLLNTKLQGKSSISNKLV